MSAEREPPSDLTPNIDLDDGSATLQPQVGIGTGEGEATQPTVDHRAVQPPESRFEAQGFDEPEPIGLRGLAILGRQRDAL
jgi:hypothetical protein